MNLKIIDHSENRGQTRHPEHVIKKNECFERDSNPHPSPHKRRAILLSHEAHDLYG